MRSAMTAGGCTSRGSATSSGDRPQLQTMSPDSLRRGAQPERRSVRSMSAEPESWASSAATRRSMLGNRARDTKPELALRRALHALGYRYRVDARPLPELNRRADLVFTKRHVAVFVHGCYWHGCPDHYTVPKNNAGFWAEKVRRNRERDQETESRLTAAGWNVVIVWEHETVSEAVKRVERALASR